MISSDIVPINGEESNYLVFAGFCIVAAISSGRFLESLTDQVLKTANKAIKTADEAKAGVEKTQNILNEVESNLDVILEEKIDSGDSNEYLSDLSQRQPASSEENPLIKTEGQTNNLIGSEGTHMLSELPIPSEDLNDILRRFRIGTKFYYRADHALDVLQRMQSRPSVILFRLNLLSERFMISEEQMDDLVFRLQNLMLIRSIKRRGVKYIALTSYGRKIDLVLLKKYALPFEGIPPEGPFSFDAPPLI